MSNFPITLDDDSTLWRVDDNVTEIAGDAINMLRSAMFAVEGNLGLSAAGSLSDLSTRLNISLNPDGTIKASALTAVGLATLPIVNSQVGTNAGILESKLALDYGTSSLHTLIQANSVLLNSLSVYEAALEVKLNSHIAGGPSSVLRHTASMIDINGVPTDSRDGSFTWGGLIDADGYALTATNVASALNQINTNLTSHQNQVIAAHAASAISIDASNFSELLNTSTNAQEVFENIDDIELLQLGTHRATQHTNGIPKAARSLNLSSATTLRSDGYNLQVIDSTPCETFVVHNPPGVSPLDNIDTGDSIVTFKPLTNVGSVFDAQFSQVKIGDIIRINYGTVEDLRRVESIRYTPGVEWIVRINGVNLFDSDGYGAYARIDRPLYDSNIYGVLAVAAVNPVPLANYSILGSVIIGDPRGATAFGMNFDPNKLGPNNYLLYLELYPTGNPTDHVIKLPGIDVTGDAGATIGKYTLESIVTSTNNAFRATGYNYRFIAFGLNGNFGVMLADSIDGASFAIINGTNSTGSLTEGTFVSNVVGDVDGYHFDGLGFGFENANLASPTYQASWIDSTAAKFPTKIIHPVKSRNYIVNGRPFDQFQVKDQTTNGFYVAEIDSKNITGTSVEVSYKIQSVLHTSGLKSGKTVLIQPAVDYTDGLYSDVDYGRFIIKDVVFNNCHCVNDYTLITVINGIHGTANPLSSSAAVGLPVRLYFSEDSVSFDDQNIIDSSDTSNNYHRFHEIYITDQKTTFSHERARMLYTTETGQLVDTSNWHITSVSSKFRGYKDISGSAPNKYIRLFISNYNVNTGEIDGYLGQRNGSSNLMLHVGPVIRGRKNTPIRFYDDTNVDYVELFFREDTSTLHGLAISSNKWLDIEIFNSLLLDQELLPLASCEVNWNAISGKNIVEFVRNLKQYGSISELEFTQSAIDFITAGDRSLHGNGVISGFSSEVDLSNNQFLINGGTALVNGKIVITNNAFVTPPTITYLVTPSLQVVNWIICVDDNGLIKYFPLSFSTKIQYLAVNANSTQTYNIPSYSFNELANIKTLTMLYILSVNINTGTTITFNSYSDARKFIKNETKSIPLVWAGKLQDDTDTNNVSDISGHFNTFEQVATWINWTRSPRNTIKIKGAITSNSTLDFTTFQYPVVFNGEEGGVFNLNNPRGLILTSNITFKNIDFNWSPGILSYIINDNVNLDTSASVGEDSSNGCMYALVNSNHPLNNVCIDNCNFSGTFLQTQRPPYISIIFGESDLNVDKIKITNNSFIDPETVLYQCAIAIASLHVTDVADSSDPLLSNCLIENNEANNYQSIIISILASLANNFSSFSCYNTTIKHNDVGAIGYLITDYFIRLGLGHDAHKKVYGVEGLIITENTAMFIGCLDTTGHVLNLNVFTTYRLGSGNVTITNNHCSLICCNIFPYISGAHRGPSLIISENKIKGILRTSQIIGEDIQIFGIDPSSIYGLSNLAFTDYTAIYVNGNPQNGFAVTDCTNVVQIINNNIFYLTVNSQIFPYETAIYVDSCPAKIENNIISYFINNGIYYTNKLGRNNNIKVDIVGNQLYNNINTAQSYIYLDDTYLIDSDTSTYFLGSIYYTVINNSFDKYITNGSVDNMINTTTIQKFQATIKDNTNQTDYDVIRAIEVGKVVDNTFQTTSAALNYNSDLVFTNHANISNVAYIPTDGVESLSTQHRRQLEIHVEVSSAAAWFIPISVLHKNSKFISANFTYDFISDEDGGTAKNLKIELWQKSNTSVASNDTLILSTIGTSFISATGTETLTINTPSLDFPITLKNNYYIKITLIVPSGSEATIFRIGSLFLTYRY